MIRKNTVSRCERVLNSDIWSHIAESHGVSPYDIRPRLQEFIPDEYMPDFLIVHDPDHVASPRGQPESKMYRRQYPKPRCQCSAPHDQGVSSCADSALTPDTSSNTSPNKANIAFLCLRKIHKIGSGHHSIVFSAPFTLPHPLKARTINSHHVTVAAKVALPDQRARNFLDNEGKMYNALPRHLQEEWCGFNIVDGLGGRPVPVGAVVPKFYGGSETRRTL